MVTKLNATQLDSLTSDIKDWGRVLGFQQIGVSGIDVGADEDHLMAWLKRQYHGEMDYMAKHGVKRARPDELIPGTLRVISARMNYLPNDAEKAHTVLEDPTKAYVSRYALGRDYHKVLRNKLQKLSSRIEAAIGEFGYRVFTDSAPVLERAFARDSGLGWIGKHTNLIDREAGSWFFIGEIYTDLPLPIDQSETKEYCGSCTACLDVCPTQAIIAPYQLDARRCISYLTIELKGSIPLELRPLIGNRIYGCDDCQLFCPWNHQAETAVEKDFAVRNNLDSANLITLFAWTAAEFDEFTRGSAIRRISYEQWLRNIAVALGNAPSEKEVIASLQSRRDHDSPLVREHVAWALAQHEGN